MFLGTVVVRISIQGVIHTLPVRGFCDTGSTANLITEHCVQVMKIFKIRADVLVTSIYSEEIIKNKVQIDIVHRFNDKIAVPIEALVVPKIKGVFPDQHLGPTVMEPCQLADPSYNQPDSVQLLLGVGVWAQILLSKIQRFTVSPFVIGQETRFGYVIFGQWDNICRNG